MCLLHTFRQDTLVVTPTDRRKARDEFRLSVLRRHGRTALAGLGRTTRHSDDASMILVGDRRTASCRGPREVTPRERRLDRFGTSAELGELRHGRCINSHPTAQCAILFVASS
jgi:hypothetical protein